MQFPSVQTKAGVLMPQLIYGTAWKKERTAELVERAVQLGFRGIDTACQPKHYQEDGVGLALSRLARQGFSREELFIQTKFTPLAGQDPERLPYAKDAALEQQVAQSFARSQENLGTTYVDSLVLHSPLDSMTDLLKVWTALEQIHEQGGARQLGISNCYDLVRLQALYEKARIKPMVVQNRFYRESDYDRGLRAWCRTVGIHYQSFWTLTANPHLLAHPSLKAIAQEYARTEPQILFRYLTQSGLIPLTGTTSEKHMAEDLAIFSFELAAPAIRVLDDIVAP